MANLFAAIDLLFASENDRFQIQEFEGLWTDVKPLTTAEQGLFGGQQEQEGIHRVADQESGSCKLAGPNMDPTISSSRIPGCDPFMIDSAPLEEQEILAAVSSEGVASVPSDASSDSGMKMEELAVEDPTMFYSDCEDVQVKDDSEREDIVIEIVDDAAELQEPEEKSLKQAYFRRERRRKPKANAWSTRVRPAVSEVGETPRLYEQQPFADPELERCRLNALSAKANRDRKRQEQKKMQEELYKLREENRKMKLSQAMLAAKAREAQHIVERFKALLRAERLDDLLAAATCKGCKKSRCKGCALGNALC